MSTIKVNTLDSTTGTSITVPTGKTLAITDAGALTIGGTAITVGAQAVLSKTTAYTILAADFTGKSSLIVLVDVSAGTSTETVITLPLYPALDNQQIDYIIESIHYPPNRNGKDLVYATDITINNSDIIATAKKRIAVCICPCL